jgi:hypothetical protein
MMVILGTDAHKRSHTIVAADPAGAQVGMLTVAATTEGHLRAVRWADQWDDRQWAIDGSTGCGCTGPLHSDEPT